TFLASQNKIFTNPSLFPGIVILSDQLSGTATLAGDTISATFTGAASVIFQAEASTLQVELTFTLKRKPFSPPAVAPTITNQPVDQLVSLGDNASFSVTVNGTQPL